MIRPINENIAIIYEEAKEKTTDSGIIVSGSALEDRSKPAVAIVAAIGNDVKSDIKVGDTVLWSRQGKGAYGNIIIVDEDSIIAVIDTNEAG